MKQDLAEMFSKTQAANVFLHHIWDRVIDLLPGWYHLLKIVLHCLRRVKWNPLCCEYPR